MSRPEEGGGQGKGGAASSGFNVQLAASLALVLASGVAIALCLLGPSPYLGLAVGLSLGFFLPGAVVAGLFDLWQWDLIGWVVFSYYTSYALVGFLALLTVPIPYGVRGVVIFGSLLLLGLFGAYRALGGESRPAGGSITLRPRLSWRYDGPLLGLLIGYHVALILTLYPKLGYAAGSDWARHFAAAEVLWRAPRLYHKPYPPFLRAHLSTVVGLTNASVGAIATALVLTGPIYPLTLYFVGRELFPAEGYWRPAPILTAILGELAGPLSGGLSWIERMGSGEVFPVNFVWQLGIWYRSIFVSSSLLAFTLAIIFFKDFWEKGSHIGATIASLWISALYLTHIVEGFILGISITLYYLFVGEKDLKVIFKKINTSVLTGFILSSATLLWLKAWLTLFVLKFPHLLSSIAPALLASASIGLERSDIARRMMKTVSRSVKAVVVERSNLAVAFLLFVYLACLVTWVDLRGEKVISGVWARIMIPFYRIPIILGIPGVLSLLGYYATTVWGEEFPASSRTPVYFSLGSSLVALLTGHSLSLVAASGIVRLLAPEARFISTGKLLLFPAATAGLVFFLRGLGASIGEKPGRTRISRGVAASIAIVVLLASFEAIPAAMGSLAWKKLNPEERYDVEAMSFLREVFRGDLNAYAIPTTSDLCYGLDLAGAPFWCIDTIEVSDQRAPEGAILWGFKGGPASHPYLVMSALTPKQTFYSRLTSKLEPIYSNSRTRIYNLPKLHPIPTEGRVVLALPSSGRIAGDSLSDLLVALLSANALNFTTSIDLDPMTLESEILILPYDPPEGDFLNEFLHANLSQVEDWIPSWAVSFDAGELMGRHVIFGPRTVRAAAALSPLHPTAEATVDLTLTPRSESLFSDAVFGIVYSSQKAGDSSHAALVALSRDHKLYAGLVTGPGEERIPRVGTWEASRPISLRLTLEPGRAKLFVNGEPVSISRDVPLGRIGVIWTPSPGRAFDLSIHISQRTPIEWGPHLEPDSLDEYVKSGGTLVVINGNGYFHYTRELLGAAAPGKNYTASRVIGSVEAHLPREVSVQPFEGASDRPCEAVASYATEDGGLIPLLCWRREGLGHVYLLNVRPIMSDLDDGGMTREEFEEIGRVIVLSLRSIGLTEGPPGDAEGWEKENFARGFWAKEATLEFSSAILEMWDNSTFSLSAGDVGIEVQGPGLVGVWCDKPISGRLSDLKLSAVQEEPPISSFYAAINLSGYRSLNLTFPDGVHVLVWESGGLRELRLPPGNYSLEVHGGIGSESALYVRTPQIFSEGPAEFLRPLRLDFVAYESLYEFKSVSLNGTLSLEVEAADSWLILDHIAFDGQWELRPAPLEVKWKTMAISFGKAVLIVLPLSLSVAALGVISAHGENMKSET